jgi:subtilisin family serine protease
VLLFALLSLSAAYVPLIRGSAEVVPNRYIVVFKNILDEEVTAELESATQKYAVSHQYTSTIKGFAAELTAEHLREVRQNSRVSYVEEDTVVSVAACSPRVAVNSWGLTRISEAEMSLDGFYSYPTHAGKGVVIYVVDTGVYLQHSDFEGRATFGFKSETSWSEEDRNGHGTHVASTCAGRAYGVSRQSDIIAVKVLGDNGSGTMAGVIAGVDWVVGQYLGDRKLSVINMSLGGGYSPGLNQACDAAVANNVVVVVAAGNSNTDACSSSPSSADDVLSIGSTDIGVQSDDVRSYFSNYGPCVHLFAPGSDITAAWIGTPTATRTISGTSMASPHVAGVAALLRADSPSASAETIQNSVVSSATPDMINLQCPPSGTCSQSPNLMAWNGCLKGRQ